MPQISRLGLRVFGFSALAIALALGASLLVVRRVAGRAAASSIDRALSAAQAAIQDKLAARSATLRATTERLVAVPAYAAAVERALLDTDRGTLLDAANELRAQLQADWVILTDPAGVLVAWSDRPGEAGIELAGGALVDLALQGSSVEGIWLEPTGDGGETIYQAAAAPIRAPGREAPLGAIIAALAVDSALAATLRRNTDAEIAFFTRDREWRPVANAATLASAAALVAGLGDTTARRLAATTGEGEWEGSVGLLRTADGTPLAGVIGLRSQSEAMAPYRGVERAIRWSLAGGLALALLASAWLAGRISRPVRQLVAATRRVAGGDYAPLPVAASEDEIGELGRAFQGMLDDLAEKQRLVDYLSHTSSPATERRTSAAGPASPAEPAVGRVLAGRYELREELGAGGMGVVYRAYDRELEERVAIKTLRLPTQLVGPVFLERFKQEIRLARRITDRHVVRTHDLGESDGIYFISMELVEGTGLDRLLERTGSLPPDVALPIVKQVLRALEAAHAVGVVHRDVKPGNVIVQPSGFVKVMDFGIAQLVDAGGEHGTALTQAGTLVGSPDYMAPEQLLGEPVDARADVYAAGCVLFECLSGRRVYSAPSVMALVARQVSDTEADLSPLGSAPPAVVGVVRRALAKRPNDRWPSAAAMLAALEAAGAGALERSASGP